MDRAEAIPRIRLVLRAFFNYRQAVQDLQMAQVTMLTIAKGYGLPPSRGIPDLDSVCDAFLLPGEEWATETGPAILYSLVRITDSLF